MQNLLLSLEVKFSNLEVWLVGIALILLVLILGILVALRELRPIILKKHEQEHEYNLKELELDEVDGYVIEVGKRVAELAEKIEQKDEWLKEELTRLIDRVETLELKLSGHKNVKLDVNKDVDEF